MCGVQVAMTTFAWPSVLAVASSGYADPHERINLRPTHFGTSREGRPGAQPQGRSATHHDGRASLRAAPHGRPDTLDPGHPRAGGRCLEFLHERGPDGPNVHIWTS